MRPSRTGRASSVLLPFALSGLAFVCVTGVAAAGKASDLTAKTAKGALKAGQELKAESTNLTFVTSAGNLECTSNIIKGTVEVNGAKTDEGPVSSEVSTGGEELEGKKGACKTTTPLGPTIISVSNLPWQALFTYKGINEVKGKKVSFTSHFGGGIECVFEASKVKSSFNIGGPTTIKTESQKFKVNKKASNAVCPKEGTLSGTWAVTSEGEVVETELT